MMDSLSVVHNRGTPDGSGAGNVLGMDIQLMLLVGKVGGGEGPGNTEHITNQ